MNDAFSLDGRVALVTGASRGLGFAMAQGLALEDTASVAEVLGAMAGLPPMTASELNAPTLPVTSTFTVVQVPLPSAALLRANFRLPLVAS